jgi:hypothetical protein
VVQPVGFTPLPGSLLSGNQQTGVRRKRTGQCSGLWFKSGLSGCGKKLTGQRVGYRERALDTRLGRLNLRVPKLRQGGYFPGFLEARKTSEQALVAVI